MATRPPAPLPGYGDSQIGRVGVRGGTPAAQAPGPGFFESVSLGFQRAGLQEDYGWNQERHENRLRSRIVGALKQRGIEIPAPSAVPRGGDVYRYMDDFLFRAVAAERDRDPNFLSDLNDVADSVSLTARATRERQERLAQIDQASQGGSAVGDFIGQMGRGLIDPLSYIPVGGTAAKGVSAARRILSTALRESAANVAVTAAIEPLVQRDAARLGVQRSAGDVLMDLGVSAGAGAVIGGTVQGGIITIESLTPIDRQIAREIRRAQIDPAAHADVALAREFADAVPRDARTPDEAAALAVLQREGEIAEASPFVSGPAGDDEHVRWLDLAMARLTGSPVQTPAAVTVRRADIANGSADTSRLRRPPREQLKARIRRVESSGDDAARNPRSSATGRYQFIDSTWLRYYRRRYRTGETDAQILAKRGDPALQEVLMNDLIADNAAALDAAGLDETAGALYLLHFAGERGGIGILRADPNTPIERILGDRAVAANPFLRGMSAGDVIAWADRKMGGQGGETPSGHFDFAAADAAEPGPLAAVPELDQETPDIAELLGLGSSDAPQLRTDLFGSPEEHARAQLRFERDRDAMDGFASVVDPDPETGRYDPFDRMPAFRAYIESGASLSPAKIGETLGLTPEEIRQLAQVVATSPNSPIVLRKDGGFQRRPTPPQRPRSLIEFIMDNGGIEDPRADLTAMGLGEWYKGGKFRRKDTLRPRNPDTPRGELESPEHGPEEHFRRAIEAGYFPNLKGYAETADELPDLNDFFNAIDEEMRGRPLYRIDDQAEAFERMRQRKGVDPELVDRIETMAAEMGFEMDEAGIAHAVAAMDGGMPLDEAVSEAILLRQAEEIERIARETGDLDSVRTPFDDHFTGSDRDPDSPGDGAGGQSGGQPGEPGGRGEGAAQPETLAGDADPESAGFDDPVGKAATAHADSLEHDLQMDAGEPVAGFRLTDEGDDVDARAALAEIDEQRRALDEMRACMAPAKPKGDGE